jgi:fluoride exporter
MFLDPALRAPIAISLGAIAGALSRYYLSIWFIHQFGTAFPYATFFINLTGCGIMGFFTSLVERSLTLPPEVRLMVTTGFLGAYTTFSTYGLETVHLWHSSTLLTTGFYWLGSALFGAIATYLGILLGTTLK